MGLFRILFALSVLNYHSAAFFGIFFFNSALAVESFFIISGFYMSLIICEKYKGKNSYISFLSSRFLRLYPSYFVVLLVIFIASLFISQVHTYDPISYISTLLSSHMNIQYLYHLFIIIVNNLTLNYFTLTISQGFDLLIPPAWTISMEILFYILAPFIVKRNIKFIIILAIVSLFIRLMIRTYAITFLVLRSHYFPSDLIFFLLGVIAYKIYVQIQVVNKYVFYSIYLFLLFLTLFYTVVIQIYISQSIDTWVYIFILTLSIPFIFRYTKDWYLDRLIGEYSYLIYILHSFIIFCSLNFVARDKPYFTLLVLFITVIFAIIIHYTLEIPIDNYRHKLFLPSKSSEKKYIQSSSSVKKLKATSRFAKNKTFEKVANSN